MIEGVNPPSSGTVSFRGYAYQLDVSVWAALVLVLKKNVAKFLEIEPASEEDLESEIEHEPRAAIEGIELDAYRLVIQCKLRTTGPWKVGDLSRLVSHGVCREKVKDRLRNARVRYVLVTNADLDGFIQPLAVSSLTDWPSVGAIPPTLARVLPADADERFAVLSRMDQERIDSRTDGLLATSFRIPFGLLVSCRETLRNDVFRRMKGEAGGLWTREEIEKTIKSHRGYVGESPDLESYVRPGSWSDMRDALAHRHAVIIAGPSGSGKSRAARALIAELRDEVPGLNVEYVGEGPEKILSYRGSFPVVFEVEDAWGRFEPEPKARVWNQAIGEVLRKASHDVKIIITTRNDILLESHNNSPKKWFVTLDEGSYSYEQRVAIFEASVQTLPRELQERVVGFRSTAVERLTTPLFIRRYFDVVADGPGDGEGDRAFVNRCISEAEQISIEDSLLAKIRARNGGRWAAVVWALLKTGAQQSVAALPDVQAGLTRRDPAFEDGLRPFVTFLVASHNLRERDGLLAYHHPRVEQGLQQGLLEVPELAGRTLRYLVESFVELDARRLGTGQAENAVRLTRAARRIKQLDLQLGPETQCYLDGWLRTRLLEVGSEFEDDLSLAAKVGSKESAPAELARWLMEKADVSYAFVEGWSPEIMSDDWYDWISSDLATKPICEAFIRKMLPRLNGWYTKQFPDELMRLANGLVEAFSDAALSIVEDDYNSNVEVIVKGALYDLERFKPVAEAAVDYLTQLRAKDDNGFWLAVRNGEYDDEAAERESETRGGEGYSAGALLDSYVLRLREEQGWQALRDHPLVATLSAHWISALYRNVECAPTTEEWIVLGKVLYDTRDEKFLWDVPETVWSAAVNPHLLSRIRLGSPDPALRQQAAVALSRSLTTEIPVVVSELESCNNWARVLELALDLRHAYEFLADDAGRRAIEEMAAAVSAALAELVRAVPDPVAAGELNADALHMLKAIDAGSNVPLRVVQARLLACGGFPVAALLERVLTARGDDSEDGIVAVTQAMELAGELRLTCLFGPGLLHRFANVREAALRIIARESSGPLPAELLSLAKDPGSRVRKALIKLLNARRDATHTEALLQLAADTWSPRADHYDEDSEFPIARRAAILLGEPPILDDRRIPRILDIAKSTDDAVVRQSLLNALVENGSENARRKVERIAMKNGTFRFALAAADAMVDAIGKVDFALRSELSPEVLVRRGAAISVRLALLAGAWATDEHLLSLAGATLRYPSKGVLVVAMWLGAKRGERDVAMVIAQLLPGAVVSQLKRALDGDKTMSRDALDGLGDVRTVTRVRDMFSWLFDT